MPKRFHVHASMFEEPSTHVVCVYVETFLVESRDVETFWKYRKRFHVPTAHLYPRWKFAVAARESSRRTCIPAEVGCGVDVVYVETFLHDPKAFPRRHPRKTFPRQTFPRGRTGETFPVSTSGVRVRGNVLSSANGFSMVDVETFLHVETFCEMRVRGDVFRNAKRFHVA